jgi:cysteine desulfurase family protein (TIGR01976 family)
MTALDIDFVRSQFPAFSQPSLQGQAFFENAGGSYPCKQVVDRLTRFYTSRKVQPYGPYEASRLAGEEMDEARQRMAALLNVATSDLMFGPSTTQNTYVLARAFGQMLNEGDVIIVTNQDHEANTGPWRRLERRGIEIREWSVNPETGHLSVSALKQLLDERVKLVCFPHCSNILGKVNPVARICEAVKEAGALTCVDGVSFAPHGFPDIEALGPDIYLFSAYKTYGPHQGVMVVRNELESKLPNQGHYFNARYPGKRLTPAGPDHAQIAASAGMADYVESIYRQHYPDEASPAEMAAKVHGLQRLHEETLLDPLLYYLRGRNDIRIIGPDIPRERVPTVSIATERPPQELAEELARHGIMAGGGNFYAVRLLEALGLDADKGVLRLSFVHYTSVEEMDHLMEVLENVL